MKKPKLWLFLVVIIALFLRTYHLQELPPGLYPDEAMNGNNALHALHTGEWSVFYPENNGREALFINIQAVFVKYLGNYPWVLRLPSTLFGTLTVFGIYFLARELFRKKDAARAEAIGLLSAFFAATSFWHINFSRIGFRAITAPFWMVWGLYTLLVAYRRLHEENTGTPGENPAPHLRPELTTSKKYPRSFPYFILSGILFGLGMHSYIAYRAMPAVIGCVFFIYFFYAAKGSGLKKFLTSSLTFIIFSLIAATPLLFYFITHPGSFFGRTTQVSIFSGGHAARDLALNTLKTIGMFFVAGDYNWRHNLAGRPELFWPVALCFLFGIFIAVRSFLKRPDTSAAVFSVDTKLPSRFEKISTFALSNDSFIILFSWLAFAALPVVVSSEGLPHALRSILLIPPVMILAGLGAVTLYNFLGKFFIASVRRARVFRIFCVLILWLLVAEAYTTYFILWGRNENTQGAFAANYVALGNTLNALPPTVPKYIVVKAGGVLVRDLPMPTQTVMFITDTYDTREQNAKNIHYVLPADENKIPSSSLRFSIE